MQKIIIETAARFVHGWPAYAIEGDRALAIDAPGHLSRAIAIVEHVNQARLTDTGSYGRIVGRGFVDEGKQLNLRGAKALEPACAIAARTLVIVVGRGCRRDNADECVRSACKLDGTAVRNGHLPAKFGSAFQKKISLHILLLSCSR